MFACMECGRKFRTVAAAERAAYGDHGCPKCGSSDIDITLDEPEVMTRGGFKPAKEVEPFLCVTHGIVSSEHNCGLELRELER